HRRREGARAVHEALAVQVQGIRADHPVPAAPRAPAEDAEREAVMSYSAALELVLDDLPGGDASAAALPPGVPARLDRANVTLNHGLLVGELLGIPISQAQRIIDGVSARADTDPCFHVDEQQTLRVAYSAILRAL